MGRRLGVSVAVLVLVAVALAGCSSRPVEAEGPATDAQWAAARPFTMLLCKGGYRVAANVTHGYDECNHRVTRPLADPSRFDWKLQHGPANEVSVAVDPTNPLVILGGAKDYTVSYINGMKPTPCGEYTVWMGAYRSLDGGMTWDNDLLPGFPGDTRASPLRGNACNTDPVLAFDVDGTAWFSGLNYAGRRDDASLPAQLQGDDDLVSASQIYFARSTDEGANYPLITFASVGDNAMLFNDKQWFAVDPNSDHMIVTWTPYVTPPAVPVDAAPAISTSSISYAESFDAGLTWSAPMQFTPGEEVAQDSQFSMPQYLPDGRVAVIWAADTDSTLPTSVHLNGDQLVYAEGTVTPSGTGFSPATSGFPMNLLKSSPGRDGTGPSTFRSATYPILAVDTSGGEHNGRRYVVWAEQEGPVDTDVQVLLRHSDDGMTWSEPITVNDDADGDQLMPWIDVDPRGGVHVAWMDRRNDPNNLLLDVYYAYSDDGGATFAPNVRITETSSNGDLGHHQGGFPFIGDYIGLDTSEHSATVFWAETRHTGEATRPAGSDVYSATLLRDGSARAIFDAAYTESAT